MTLPRVSVVLVLALLSACTGSLDDAGSGGAASGLGTGDAGAGPSGTTGPGGTSAQGTGGAGSGSGGASGTGAVGSSGQGSSGQGTATTTGGGGAPATSASVTTGTGDVTTGGGASASSGETTGSGDTSSAATTSATSTTAATTSAATSTSSGGPSCGDGTCDAGETCDDCASDCGACNQCEGASDATTALDAEEQALFTLINDHRADNGRGPVMPCTSLSRAAQGHSEDMRDQDYFSHDSLDGRDPWERTCNSCYEAGCGPQTQMAENIAAGNSTAAATFNQWLNSAGHNANMLGSSFVVMGLGRATGGGQYGVYWTAVFGAATEGSCN